MAVAPDRFIAEPSIQSLLIRMRFENQVLATGTGFLAMAGCGAVLITNRHNLTGRRQDTGAPMSPTGGVPDNIEILHNYRGGIGNWVTRNEPLFRRGRQRWFEHPSLREACDVVALPLSSYHEVAMHPYDPANPGPDILVGPADPVSVIGFPFGLAAGGSFGIWATGFVASEPDMDYNEMPTMLVDCRSRPGQSGSPVIAYRSGGLITMSNRAQVAYEAPIWRFMGIYSGRINPESDIGTVWKAPCIADLLRSI